MADRKQSELDLRDAAVHEQARPDRDAVLRDAISAVFLGWFPDDEDNVWNIESVAHVGDRTFVRVCPEQDAGYERFVALFEFGSRASEYAALAMYCQEQESTFGLLGTAPACPEDIPPVIFW